MNKLIFRIPVALFCLISAAECAISEPVKLQSVLEDALKNHPELRISHIDRSIAKTESMRVEGMLDPSVSGSLMASEELTPVSSSFQAAETRTGQFSGIISKPLSNGGTLAANVIYNSSSQSYTSPLAAQLALFNPAYRSQINVSYRHPLLKGSDRPDYHQSQLVAEAGILSAELQQQIIVQKITLQSLNAYYQLASDDINIRIASQAVKRAEKLLAYQKKREQFGLIETADRLQAEALLAARNTDLQRARARRANSLSGLNRIMRRQPDARLQVDPEQQPVQAMLSFEQANQRAELNRPEVRILQAQLQAAEAQLTMSRENDQLQLDLIAELGTRALDSNASTAAAKAFTVKDRYAGITLELSDVIGRNSVRAGIEKAELQRQRIAAQRVSTLEQIKTDVANAMTALQSGQPTLAVARKQAKAEKRKFAAEMKRYRQGRSDTATLVQFEAELSTAELNADLQALTLQLAEKQLLWAQGDLLNHLGIDLIANQEQQD